MAKNNPNFLPAFDANGTNTEQISQNLQDDGYAINEIPTSGQHNSLFKQIFTVLNFIKKSGVFEYENSVTYNKGAIITFNGNVYISKIDGNTTHLPTEPKTWEKINGNVTLSTAQEITGSKTFDAPITYKDNDATLDNQLPTLGLVKKLFNDTFTKIKDDLIALINKNTGGGRIIDVTSARAANIEYENDTGRSIYLKILINGPGNVEFKADLMVDDVLVDYAGITRGSSTPGGYLSLSFVVPHNSKYKVLASGAQLVKWLEIK